MQHTVYFIGLIVAISYLIFSIDDIVWDLIYMLKKNGTSNGKNKISYEELDTISNKLLAVMIAAWHEEGVLEPVIDHMIESVHYPRSMYHIFLGVYPNDYETLSVAEKLQLKYDNVHIAVNPNPGPSSKADNLNQILKYIENFEQEHNWKFASVTVHDSEDVVHPYELKITNYLIDKYDILQFPVFPIQRMPSINNIFSGMTTGTYADEFAENHFRIMRMRDDMNAVVPSAGTGFVISASVLSEYVDKPLFPQDSLTEDYKLSLILSQKGFHIHYVFEKVPRLMDNYKVKWDYVATRSIFPSTFHTALRQKTRWIYGITMQSFKFRDIFKNDNNLNFASKYTLYKDMKAKIGNLLVLPGYIVFLYFILSLFFEVPVMYPKYTFSWWLCMILTCTMIFRQLMRAVAIKNVYGFKSMVVSCFLPPFMPIRLVWGNIINMCATFCAWKQLIFGIKKLPENKKIVWNKTDHEFLNKQILKYYHRNIGDELLEKQYIDIPTLKIALMKARKENLRLGDILLKEKLVTEEQLMRSIANVQHKLFIKEVSAFKGDFKIKPQDMELFQIYPLFKTEDCFVFAETNYTPSNAYEHLGLNQAKVFTVITTRESVINAIKSKDVQSHHLPSYEYILNLLLEERITWEQAVLAFDTQITYNADLGILNYMGLCINSFSQDEICSY